MAQLSETSVKPASTSALTAPATTHHQDATFVTEGSGDGKNTGNTQEKCRIKSDAREVDTPHADAGASPVTSSCSALQENNNTTGCSPESRRGACCNADERNCGHCASDEPNSDSVDIRCRDPVTSAGQPSNCQCPIGLGEESNNAASVTTDTGQSERRSDLKILDVRPGEGNDSRLSDNKVIGPSAAATGTCSAIASSPKPAEDRCDAVKQGNSTIGELDPALQALEQPLANLPLSSNGSSEGSQETRDLKGPAKVDNSATDNNRKVYDIEVCVSHDSRLSEQCVPTPATTATSGGMISVDRQHSHDLKTSKVNVDHDCTIVAGNIGGEGLQRSISRQTAAHETTEQTATGSRLATAGESERTEKVTENNAAVVDAPRIIFNPYEFHSKLHENASSEKTGPSPTATSESVVELTTFSKKTSAGLVIPRTQNRDEPVLTLYKRRSDDVVDPVFRRQDAAAASSATYYYSGNNAENGAIGANTSGGNSSSVHFDDGSSTRIHSTSNVNDLAYVERGAGIQSLSERPKSWDNYSAVHAEVELRPKKGRGGRRHGDRRDRSSVSLTGIQVVVETNPKRSKSKQMVKLQSPRLQCCLCGCTVFSALIGIFMLSAGVCLVLNYNFLEVDTSGLPPDLHNDEGKKVVGIILISIGIAAMVIGGLVSFLYFTSCNLRPNKTNNKTAAATAGGSKGQGRDAENGVAGRGGHGGHHRHHHHLNGATQGRASPALSGSGSRRQQAGSLPNLRRGVPDPRHHGTPGSSTSLKDGALPGYSRSGAVAGASGRNGTPPSAVRAHGQKSRHGGKVKGRHGRYKNPLAPHPEEGGGDTQSLHESRKSASSMRRQLFMDNGGGPREEDGGGYVNKGAKLDDEEMQGSEGRGSVSSGSSVTPSVIIRVDSTHARAREEEEEERDTEEVPTEKVKDEVVVTSTPIKPVLASFDHHPGDTVTVNLNGEEVQSDTGAPVGPSQQHRQHFNEVTLDEDESGRISRSTVDSSDTLDEVTKDEDPTKRLNNQINRLLLS